MYFNHSPPILATNTDWHSINTNNTMVKLFNLFLNGAANPLNKYFGLSHTTFLVYDSDVSATNRWPIETAIKLKNIGTANAA